MKHLIAAISLTVLLATPSWAQPQLVGTAPDPRAGDTAQPITQTGDSVVAGQVRCAGLTVTQNTNPNLVLFPFSVACINTTFNCTLANDYARSFDLSMGPTAGRAHLVRCVEYGVDQVLDSTGFSPVTVSLFVDTNAGAPNNANLAPLPGGSMTDMVPHGTAGALRSVDFTPNNVLVPADATLVVVVSSPDLCATRGSNHRYTNGANDSGQSAPSYVRAPACGIAEFADLATLGPFGDVHMVLSVGLQPHGLSATKTDALLTDVDGDGEADPGDTLRYTVRIRNVGTETVENVQFSDTIDPNTTLVPGSVKSTPIARDDNYVSIGNVGISVPAASGVLINDNDPDGDPIMIVAFDAVSANGGSVLVDADGAFVYSPAAGFEGDDTFTYTIEDSDGNQDSATVTIAVSDVIWFIDNEAAGPGTGRLGSPFSSVANFVALANDDPGDVIFVYSGDGLYAGTVTLLNDQFLIGQGATDSIASITGITVPPFSNPLPATGSFRPLLEYVNVAMNNYVRGLDLRGSTAATALLGGNVGTLHVSEMAVTNTAGPGVSLATGTLDVTLDSVNTTLGVHGIRMSAVNGSFASLGGTIQDTTSHGVFVTNNGATLDLTLADMLIDDAAAFGVLIEVPAGGTGGFGLVTVDDVTISDSTTGGLRASISNTGVVGLLDIFDGTFTNNLQGIEVIASGTADVEFDIHDNLALSGRGTQILISAQDATANNGIGPILEGRIANNAGIVSTGAGGTAVAMTSVGDGDIIVDVDGNTITGFGQLGMVVQADTGQSQIHATIRNNAISTADTSTQAGLHMRSALSAGQTSLVCVNLSGNNIDAGGGTVSLADYSLIKGASVATFQIQGLPGAPVVVAATGPGSAVGTYVKNTDLNPGIRTETVGAGTYAAAVCQVAMPSAAREAPAVAAVGNMPVISTRDNDPREEAELMAPSVPGGGVVASGETVNLNIGSLDPGQEVTITFDVTIDNPVDPRNTTQVCNQGSVSSDNALTVLTDDPDTPAEDDPTCTPLDVATITIGKAAVGGDVGDDPTFQFHGSDPIGDFGLMAGGSQAFPNLTAGTYTVTEDLPPGWVFDQLICTVSPPSDTTPVDGGISIMLNGGDASCTFHNRYQRGNLVVIKEADPADDTVFSYTTDIPSTPNFTLRDPSFPGKNIPAIPIGDYTITEAAMPGWVLREITCTGGNYTVQDNSVTVTIPDQGTVSCTFRNQRLGSITVRKESDPDGGTDFAFRGRLGDFTLDDDGEQLFKDLEKGDYSIIESVPAGWRLDSVVCEGAGSTPTDGGVIVHLTAGEDVVCTFYDVFVPERVSASKKGSLLMFSKIELRWADGPAGALRQDTVLELTNDYHEDVCVQLYIVNGDAPLDPVLDPVTGSVVVEGEPGWEWADCQFCLTPDQTTYWSAATGLAAGCQPFTALDPSNGSGPGRPDPTAPGERHLRGFVYAWAVDQDGHAISWNHLSGAATLINYFNTDAWDYNAWAFQANLNCTRICEDPGRCETPQLKCTAVPHGGRIGEPGRLRIDGYEYDFGFDVLLMDFMASGSRALGSGTSVVTSDTDLTLHPITADLRQDSIGPVTTKAEFAIWNEDERRFSGTTRCITCWDQTLLSLYGNPNHFLREHLQTDKGKARIDGVESTVCDVNCVRNQYPHGGLDIDFILDILGIDHVCSYDASMLGVVAKTLAFSGAATARTTAGRNLVGMGTESGWIKWDIVAPPSHVRAPVEKTGRTGRAPR